MTASTYGGRLSFLVQADRRADHPRHPPVVQESRQPGHVNTVDVDPATLAPLYGDLTQSRTSRSPTGRLSHLQRHVDYDFGLAKLTSIDELCDARQDTNEDATAMYGGLLTGALRAAAGRRMCGRACRRRFTQEVRLASRPAEVRMADRWLLHPRNNALSAEPQRHRLIDRPQVVPGFGGLADGRSADSVSRIRRVRQCRLTTSTDRFDLSAGWPLQPQQAARPANRPTGRWSAGFERSPGARPRVCSPLPWRRSSRPATT